MTYYKQIIYLSLFTFVSGMAVYFWYNHWPSIQPIQITETTLTDHSSRSARITYWAHNEFKSEQKSLLWSSSIADRICKVVQAWLTLMDEESLLSNSCTLQSVTLSKSGLEAFISFDHSPLPTQSSTYNSWMILESLFHSLKDNTIEINSVRFLERHQPLEDNHLDFSKSWPIEGFLHIPTQTIVIPEQQHTATQRCRIIIDPAGDASTTGRVIDDTFERGITLQYAQAVAKALQVMLPQATINVARLPGEAIEPLRNAIIANRLGVDLYISINFYAEKEKTPLCLISHMMWNQFHDRESAKQQALSFIPYQEAYRNKSKQSYTAACCLKNILEQTLPSYKIIVAGIPYKTLLGVTVPAISLELGIYTKDGWQKSVQPLAAALIPAINALCVTK